MLCWTIFCIHQTGLRKKHRIQPSVLLACSSFIRYAMVSDTVWKIGAVLCQGPVWARGRCRISPPRFLAECCKRQLNQVSLVLLCVRLSAFSDLYWVCLSVFSCTVLFVSISQVIGCEDRLRNDLYCVGWGVKLYSNQTKSLSSMVSTVEVNGCYCWEQHIILTNVSCYQAYCGKMTMLSLIRQCKQIVYILQPTAPTTDEGASVACSNIRLWKLDSQKEWRNTSGRLWDERT